MVMERISKIIEEAYFLPKEFSSLECGANNIDDIQTIDWITNKNCWLMEPIPKFAKEIKDNLTKNLVESALSTFNGKSKFYIFEQVHGWSCLSDLELNSDQKFFSDSKKEIEVECITYDALQDNLGINFDVLILDIEGYEDNILKYMNKISKKYFPKIFCIECGYQWEDRKKLIKNLGYNLDFYYYNNAFFRLEQCNIEMNEKKVFEFNNLYKEWSFNGQLIYVNEKVNQ
jgi:FkbM family methyltransferase